MAAEAGFERYKERVPVIFVESTDACQQFIRDIIPSPRVIAKQPLESGPGGRMPLGNLSKGAHKVEAPRRFESQRLFSPGAYAVVEPAEGPVSCPMGL
jgi:hypothetical protein